MSNAAPPSFQPCALIPVYNHPHKLPTTVAALRAHGLPVVLVDDGSNADCKTVLNRLAAGAPDIHLLTLAQNGGKGAAVKAGLNLARQLGLSHALQVDADGQHDCSVVPVFLELAQSQPKALVCGVPEYDASVPKGRYYSRYITHVWVWINTLSLTIQDSMCGFRVYPVAASDAANRSVRGNRMDFDTEFLVRWFWAGQPLVQKPIRVIYPDDGISHFNLWRDNKLISAMHARLFFGMLVRSPRLLGRKLSGRSATA